MKKIVGVLVALLVLFAAAYAGSPFWAARQFRNAAIAGDAAALERTTDFPAVRDGLKAQLTTSFAARMQGDPALRNNPFAGLGAMLMPAIVGRMVDTLVTPDGLAAMVRQGKVGRDGPAANGNGDIHYSYAWRGLDRFAVTATAATHPGEAPVFVWERRGLFSWKLTRLELPATALTPAR